MESDYGAVTPVAAYAMACLGSALGLRCTIRSLRSDSSWKPGWLALGAAAIGSGIWTMHFVAMMGFHVAQTPVTYDLRQTVLSLVVAIVMVGVGVFVVGYRGATRTALLAAGLTTGLGVAVTGKHYTGMSGLTVRLHEAHGSQVPGGGAAVSIVLPMMIGPLAFLLLAAVVVMFDPDLVLGEGKWTASPARVVLTAAAGPAPLGPAGRRTPAALRSLGAQAPVGAPATVPGSLPAPFPASSAMRSWWRITSAMMKFSSFSANAGSRLALCASCRSRAIWRVSRAGSAGGSLWSALRRPTCWVALKRSASMWTTAASMLSMLSRSRFSSAWTDASISLVLMVSELRPTGDAAPVAGGSWTAALRW